MRIKYKRDPREKDGETILSFFKNKRSFGFFRNVRFADTVDFITSLKSEPFEQLANPL